MTSAEINSDERVRTAQRGRSGENGHHYRVCVSGASRARLLAGPWVRRRVMQSEQ